MSGNQATGLYDNSFVSSTAMNRPLVSICLPTLNSRRFLAERLESICQQTLCDWELIAVDSKSQDGTFESLEKLASRDPRFRLHQTPADGIYSNINRSIEYGSGKYVYVATSDDTMPPDFLEKMVDALESHPGSDLAHCRVKMIDEEGHETLDWWSTNSVFARSSGHFLDIPHLRSAPFDGLLHLLGRTVYTSLTQLLVRRSLFEKIGLFGSRWGSISDFDWDMRAALVSHTIHVPNTWGGWRLHSDQATAHVNLASQAYRSMVDEMIEHAISRTNGLMAPEIRGPLESQWSARMSDFRNFAPAILGCRNTARRRVQLAGRLLSGSWAARQHVKAALLGSQSLAESAPEMIRRWLESTGTGPLLVPL